LESQNTLEAEAKTAMMRADWARACDLWAELRTETPDSLVAFTSGIEALIRAYRFDEAFLLADKMEGRFGGHPRTEMALAALQTRRGLWAAATARYEKLAGRSDKLAERVQCIPTYRQAVFNTFGILEGSRRLQPVLHETRQHPDAECRGYVFISGMPRSGTTALGHLMNVRTEIALFVELHNPYLTYSPSSFAPEVIARQRARHAAVAPEQIVERARTAAFIGDKRPLFHYSLPHTLAVMADHPVVVLHILRAPLLVAASYQRRAANPDDGWDPLRDLGNCIDEINVMHRFLLDWHRDGNMAPRHRLIHVDYDRAFRDPDYAIGLFETIGVQDLGASRGAITGFQERSAQILARERKIDPEIRWAVAAGLDREAARGVADLTGIDVLGELDR